MKTLLYLIIPKIYAALPFIPGKNPEDYEINDVAGGIKFMTDLFFVTVVFGAVIMIIWGSILYLTAYGNEEKAQKGKTAIMWAIIGLVVGILAKVIVGEVTDLLTGQREIPVPE